MSEESEEDRCKSNSPPKKKRKEKQSCSSLHGNEKQVGDPISSLDTVMDVLNEFDWTELEKKEQTTGLRAHTMGCIIKQEKSGSGIKTLKEARGEMFEVKGCSKECQELLYKYFGKKLEFALVLEERGRYVEYEDPEFFVNVPKPDKNLHPCLGCGSMHIRIYHEHKERIWSAVEWYLKAKDLFDINKKDEVRTRHYNKMRKAAYAAFHNSYHGRTGRRIPCLDCVEFRIKYYLDAEHYMGYRDK